MGGGGPWTILEYTTDAGRCPVRDFLEGLKGRHEEEALALLGRLREAGNELRRPTSAALGGGKEREPMAKLTRNVMRWVDERLAHDADLRRRVERRMAELRLEEELLALRESRGFTQAQVAKLLGVSQPAVAKLEAGATNVKLLTLCRYAEALGAELRVELVRQRVPRQRAAGATTR